MNFNNVSIGTISSPCPLAAGSSAVLKKCCTSIEPSLLYFIYLSFLGEWIHLSDTSLNTFVYLSLIKSIAVSISISLPSILNFLFLIFWYVSVDIYSSPCRLDITKSLSAVLFSIVNSFLNENSLSFLSCISEIYLFSKVCIRWKNSFMAPAVLMYFFTSLNLIEPSLCRTGLSKDENNLASLNSIASSIVLGSALNIQSGTLLPHLPVERVDKSLSQILTALTSIAFIAFTSL